MPIFALPPAGVAGVPPTIEDELTLPAAARFPVDIYNRNQSKV